MEKIIHDIQEYLITHNTSLHIVVIVGKKGSGKSTIAKHLTQHYNFVEYTYSHNIKKICEKLFGFTETQMDSQSEKSRRTDIGVVPRDAFQKIGTEFGQKIIHEMFPTLKLPTRTIWIYSMYRKIFNDIMTSVLCPVNGRISIVISDLRFIREYDELRKLEIEKLVLIEIKRDDVTCDDYNCHISESEILDYINTFEHNVIYNNFDLERLYFCVDEIICQC